MENEDKAIAVIVGALGMIKKGTQKYVDEIPGNLSLAEKNSVKQYGSYS